MILLRKIISGRTGYMKIMNLALNLNISVYGKTREITILDGFRFEGSH